MSPQEIPQVRDLLFNVMQIVDVDPAVNALVRNPRVKLEVAIVSKETLDEVIRQHDPKVSRESLKEVDGYTVSDRSRGPGFYRMFVEQSVLADAARSIVTVHHELHHAARAVGGLSSDDTEQTERDVRRSAVEGLHRIERSLRSSPRVAYQQLSREIEPYIAAEARRAK